MANDFSGDPDCVALWKLENNADDAIGGNDLTEVNSPAYDSSDKKEGSYCIDLERDSYQYGTIDDGDLDSGFPGKSGAGESSFSICCWVKAESLVANGGMVSKYVQGSGYRTFMLRLDNGEVGFFIGYNGGSSYTELDFDSYLESGKWYHIGAVYDAADNGLKLRIWDDTAGALLDDNKEGTAGGDMSPTPAPFEIGRYAASNNYCFDGKLDEVVIFSRVLSDDDIDAIRAGTYSAGATEKSSADSGSGVDAIESLQTPQAKTSSDAGSGAEGAPSQGAALTADEGGSGLEALISRLLSDGESGGAEEEADLDTEEPPRELSASEEAEGADRLVAKIEMPAKGGGMKLWT